MTTVTALRQTYLNLYLHRTDGDTRPWTNDECDQYLEDALSDLWPENGQLASGDITSDANLDAYTAPATVPTISRIALLDDLGRETDRITDWRVVASGKVILHPVVSTGYTIRFYGWAPFSTTGSDLPARLENTVAMYAAALAYGALAAEVSNSQRMQNLDSGRIVDQQTAAQMSAYWQRRAEVRLIKDPSRVTLAPRMARR